MKDSNSYIKCLRTAFGIVALMSACFLVATAQQEDLYGAPGKIVAESYNKVQVGAGDFKVTSYSLEEVKLTQPLERVSTREAPNGKPSSLELYEQRDVQRLESVLRLTVNGDFPNGAYILWIDDVPLRTVGYGRNKIMVILYGEGGVLEPGATLAVSRHTGSDDLHAPRAVLPETLLVPGQLQRSHLNAEVQLRKVATGVEIIIGGTGKFEATNAALVLQIGREEFLASRFADGEMTSVIFTLTPEEFALTKDGDRVLLKRGRGIASSQKLGQLNKGLVNIK
ncbi:MAG TPA: hypothetical protein VN643_21550 [Pyrinomonadaceae bacterium]|nr:hypothetical protein [Pyrinomonadaceae bacterium]